ncbi:UNVERIFIED_CONTAM: hypothetical protein K2H54_056474 [Gekko kuhli]
MGAKPEDHRSSRNWWDDPVWLVSTLGFRGVKADGEQEGRRSSSTFQDDPECLKMMEALGEEMSTECVLLNDLMIKEERESARNLLKTACDWVMKMGVEGRPCMGEAPQSDFHQFAR